MTDETPIHKRDTAESLIGLGSSVLARELVSAQLVRTEP
jgi:hypothetical protein